MSITQNEIIRQVQEEYTQGLEVVDQKREKFRKRLEMYSNISGDDKKVYVRMIYAVMQTMLGIYFQDELSVEFLGREFGDMGLAENLNNLAKYDFDEMELDILNYKVQWDRLFYGVGIRVFDHWNEDKLYPTFNVVSPLSWIPDPRGNYWNDFRWHGFEVKTTKRQLEEAGVFKNLDQVSHVISTEDDKTRSSSDGARELNHTNSDVTDNPIIYIYNHYTYINGVPMLITLANDRTVVIREQDLTEFGGFPVALNYYSPLEMDPFGVSVCDLLEDKQKQQQLFLNLQTFKATREAWGGIFLYNSSKISNIQDLKTPGLGPKYLEVEGDVANAVVEVQRDQISQDVYNMPEVIKSQAVSDLGLDERALGISPQSGMTKAENVRVQQNQNVKLALTTKVNMKGEKTFWEIWYMAYKLFFDVESEKNVRLNGAYGNVMYPLRKEDIITSNDLDITIQSKAELENEINAKKQEFFALTQPMLMDPSYSQSTKNYITAQRLKMIGLPKYQVTAMMEQSPDELQAMDDLNLLNVGEFIDLEVTPEVMKEDHKAYINIYQQATPGPARDEAIATRVELYRTSGQASQDRMMQQQGNPAQAGIGNAQAAQLTAGAMSQEQSSDIPSLQDV